MTKTIYTYDKEARCEYCEHYSAGNEPSCKISDKCEPCQNFRYDVFKRKPRHSPKLQQFKKEDFTI